MHLAVDACALPGFQLLAHPPCRTCASHTAHTHCPGAGHMLRSTLTPRPCQQTQLLHTAAVPLFTAVICSGRAAAFSDTFASTTRTKASDASHPALPSATHGIIRQAAGTLHAHARAYSSPQTVLQTHRGPTTPFSDHPMYPIHRQHI
jgi:hypothetical protein